MTESEQRGQRLEQLGKHLKLKQITLAQRLGVSRGFVSRMMSGKEDITGRVIKKLSEMYPLLNMNWLMKGEGEMFTEKKSIGAEEPSVPYEPLHEEDLHEEIRRLRRLVGVTALEKELDELRARLERVEAMLSRMMGE